MSMSDLSRRARAMASGNEPEVSASRPEPRPAPRQVDFDPHQYPSLATYTRPMSVPERSIIGREDLVDSIMSQMRRPELTNVILVAEAGTGKTALVQWAMQRDTDRVYVEVITAYMLKDLPNRDELATRVRALYEEAILFREREDVELVLFEDEFHQLVMNSAASVEALKPLLAESGARGVRTIAATTYEEYHQYIEPNDALMQRLQTLHVPEPDEEAVMAILKDMARKNGVDELLRHTNVYSLIYDYTNRYQVARSQPRKSILLLDLMIGKHRELGRRMDEALLAEALMESANVNVTFQIDATKLKTLLRSRVFAQDLAVEAVSAQLQVSVADLHDHTRPPMSMLLPGSTGVGKLCSDSTPVPVLLEDGSAGWKTHGQLRPGDRVFQRDGSVQDVLGHFPQGVRDIYRVTTWDGRELDVGGPHLWGVYTAKMRKNKHDGKDVEPRIMTTLEMIEAGVVRTYPGDSRQHTKFFLPMNGAVQWPERDLDVDPYALGALIGNGCLTLNPLTISSDDPEVVASVADSMGVSHKLRSVKGYAWSFPVGKSASGSGRDVLLQTKDALASVPDLIGAYSTERRVPEAYMMASIEQRWALVQGLFDTDGTIDDSTGRFNVSYSTFSEGLAEDVRQLLFSLGVSSSHKVHTRTRDDGRVSVEHDVHVRVGNEDKVRFFRLERKRRIAERAAFETAGRTRVKKFDMVGIKSIEKLDRPESSSCIYVSGEEHLYQAGQFVVTHNTQMTKEVAKILFGDSRRHLRIFDMTEFSLETSVDRFKTELTRHVSERPYSVLLIDEVEKAHKNVVGLLLQVLDDGRLSDEHGRTASFLNTYIIMTTNAGSEVFNEMSQTQANLDHDTEEGRAAAAFQLGEYSRLFRRSVESTTKGSFPPELIGRVRTIAPFRSLDLSTFEKVTMRELESLVTETWKRHGCRVRIQKASKVRRDGREVEVGGVVRFIVHDLIREEAKDGGARQVASLVQEWVTTKVAQYINEHPGVKEIQVKVEGTLMVDDPNTRMSSGRVVIDEVRPQDLARAGQWEHSSLDEGETRRVRVR